MLMESYPLKLGEAVPVRERPRDLVGEAGRLPLEGDRAATERLRRANGRAALSLLRARNRGYYVGSPRNALRARYVRVTCT